MRISKEEEHKRLAKMQENENRLRAEGFSLICGVDEAGRGPLAGPVCAAAVILADDVYIEGLNDSKKLSEKRRQDPERASYREKNYTSPQARGQDV